MRYLPQSMEVEVHCDFVNSLRRRRHAISFHAAPSSIISGAGAWRKSVGIGPAQ
jgi:hypothetical protein